MTSNSVSSPNESSIFTTSPHSCQYCQAITVHLPSTLEVGKLELGQTIVVARISGLYVSTALAHCLFFEWACTKVLEGPKLDAIDESWILSLGILEGHLEDYPDIPFLIVSWKHCEDEEQVRKSFFLTVYAESGLTTQHHSSMCSGRANFHMR
jgi:hypothetical protein